MTVALGRNYEIIVGVVRAAFLHDDLIHGAAIYVRPPKEYSPDRQRVCNLTRALFALRPAPRNWQYHVANRLPDLGGRRIHGDPTIYRIREATTGGDDHAMVYANDMICVLGTGSLHLREHNRRTT